jgi:uncharacterized SAM-binding protein YcdF (DUF218 family)
MTPTAIVVLGAQNDPEGRLSATARERCERALREYREHPGALVVPTGGWGQHFNMTARPHGDYVRDYLIARGVPEDALLACVESASTIEDAGLCRPVVERLGLRRLVVVTSDYHVARAALLFTRAFPDVALEFAASATQLPEQELRRRVDHERNAIARLMEDGRA